MRQWRRVGKRNQSQRYRGNATLQNAGGTTAGRGKPEKPVVRPPIRVATAADGGLEAPVERGYLRGVVVDRKRLRNAKLEEYSHPVYGVCVLASGGG